MDMKQRQDFFIRSLWKGLIVLANGEETGINHQGNDFVGHGSDPVNGTGRSYRSGDIYLVGSLTFRGHNRSLGRGASRQTIVDNQNGFPGEGLMAVVMEFGLVIAQPIGFFSDDLVEVRAGDMRFPHCDVIQEHNAMFGERPHRKLTMPRVADLPDHQHIKRPLQDAGHLGRNHHSTARQPENDIWLNVSFDEMIT